MSSTFPTGRAARLLTATSVTLALAAAVAAALPGAAQAQGGPAAAPGCREVSLPVSLAEGGPTDEVIAGTLCIPRRLRSDALQVLVPGVPFDRSYWDFPGAGQRYSYVSRAQRAGAATLAVDRLGTGRSSRPPADQITIDSEAEALEQVVQAARAGDLGAPASVGSAVVLQHAGTSHDVDGVVVTGLLHAFGPSITQFGTIVVPASDDPITAKLNPPPGYLTVTRDAQSLFGFTTETSTARIRAAADMRKTTFTGPEGDGFARVIGDTALSRSIDVPVLVVVGEDDSLFCTAGCPAAATESQAYADGADLRVMVIPATAHNLNLHLTAPRTHAITLDWFTDRFGNRPTGDSGGRS
jgi:pimeloyl-ACP methyl ester carboxylesterase